MVTVLSLLVAAMIAFAAVRKLSHREEVVRSYARVGVPEERLDLLAAILLAGAAGLVVGLAWEPVGVAATAGVACYFVLACAAHVRFGDSRRIGTPLAILALAVALLLLR